MNGVSPISPSSAATFQGGSGDAQSFMTPQTQPPQITPGGGDFKPEESSGKGADLKALLTKIGQKISQIPHMDGGTFEKVMSVIANVIGKNATQAGGHDAGGAARPQGGGGGKPGGGSAPQGGGQAGGGQGAAQAGGGQGAPQAKEAGAAQEAQGGQGDLLGQIEAGLEKAGTDKNTIASVMQALTQ